MSIIKKLHSKGLIKPEQYVLETQYETMMWSVAYGVNSDNSDIDIYGFCIPPKKIVFPHLNGEIEGFGRQKKRFDQFQQHHIQYEQTNYDLSIYSIIKYFSLCMENNPNMIDSLFTPNFCVLHATKIGNMVRDNRKIFLHKGAWFKFKGYSFSQMHKIKTKNPERKRVDIIDKYGYDTKFAYHVVRLLNEIEQILIEGDLDLLRNREQLKSIRNGEWTLTQIEDYFTFKEKDLEQLYTQSTLQHSPDENTIKTLLLNCLEEYYGNLENCIIQPDKYENAIKDIMTIINNIK